MTNDPTAPPSMKCQSCPKGRAKYGPTKYGNLCERCATKMENLIKASPYLHECPRCGSRGQVNGVKCATCGGDGYR